MLRTVAMLACAGFMVAGCGWHTWYMNSRRGQSESGVGYVTARHQPDGRTELQVEVYNMLVPSVAGRDAEYVVWLRSRGRDGVLCRLGVLTLRSFEEQQGHAGLLTALAWESSFELFITAEPPDHRAVPSQPPLLWTSVSPPLKLARQRYRGP